MPDPLAGDISAATTALQNISDGLQTARIKVAALQSDATSSANLSPDARVQALNSVPADLKAAQDAAAALVADPAWSTVPKVDASLTADITANPSDPLLVQAQGLKKQLDDAQNVASGTGDGSLTQAVTALANDVADVADALSSQIKNNSLNGLGSTDDATTVRKSLVAGMEPLAVTVASVNNFRATWSALKKFLSAAQATPVDTSLAGCDTQISAVVGKLPDWFDRMVSPNDAGDLKKTLDAVTKAMKGNNRTSEDMLNAPIKQTEVRTEANLLTAISGTWPKLVALLEPQYPTQIEAANGKMLTQLAAIAGYNDLAAAFDELLTGDLSKFVGDQVRLFYFTDVPRLMHVLNPTTHMGPISGTDPQAAADTARQNLINAENAAIASRTAVNEAKTDLRNVQEEIRLVNARAEDAANQAATAHVLLQRIKKQQTALNYKVAHPDPAATPDALQALLDQQTILNARVASATTATSNADTAASAAKDAQSQLAVKSAALPQKLLDAQRDAATAHADLDKEQVIAANLAQVESDAFANARDNAPYLEATPRVTSNDPGQRVILLGYPDDKTIFVRGLAKDVETVKDMIAEFDRPAPQARITLWTLQVNGTDTEKLADIMQNVDQHLLLTRTLTGFVQDRLRDSLSYVVSHVQDEMAPAFDSLPAFTPLPMYNPPHAPGYNPPSAPGSNLPMSTGDRSLFESDPKGRLMRYQFYQPEILSRLGYTLPALSSPPRGPFNIPNTLDLGADSAYVTRFTLPDPVHGTTLGEMLFVLSLGRKQYREAVLTRFLLSLETIPVNLPGFGSHHDDLALQRGRLEQFTRGLAVIAGRNITAQLNSDLGTTSRVDPISLPADPTGLIREPSVIELQHKMFLSNYEMKRLLFGLKNISSNQTSGSFFSEQANQDSFFPRFPAAILGSFTDFGALPLVHGTEELTSNQNEILLAVQAQARENISTEIKVLLQRLNDLDASDRSNSLMAHTLRMQYLPLVGMLYSKYDTAYDAARNAGPNVTWLQQGLLAVGALKRSETANLRPLDRTKCEDQLTAIETADKTRWPMTATDGTSWKTMDQQAWLIASLSGQHNSLSQATARVAAADDMIKRLIITIEDDLDYFFVQPELSAIRQETARKGVELGTFQRESLLATNRRVARIDPRANADVELTGGTDFLQEASQLASIADRFKQEQTADKLTSSGPAALAGTLSLLGDRAGSALGVGAALSVLGDLFTQPQPVGEIYSINSGNLFKITPIFDPSGQALSFQFDYAGTTDVREPDGTTNPSIPRVERHTVNTEVQLTNLELREVSRFEANSSLGTPEQRTGGLPLLKHLPILKDIPLIGYFARTDKKGASRQESLIFAQTSMYPTVADIVNLLVDIPPLTGADRTEPNYLTNPDLPAQNAVPPPVPAVAPPVGNDRGNPVGAVRQRDKVKKAASISDFILPAGMQP